MIQKQLKQLACDLQRTELWSEKKPTPEQLKSREPFCIDTLAFEQWLQWIFIPRLNELLAQPHFNGLPNPSAIHSMAEHVFKDYKNDTNAICSTLKQIDGSLNAFDASVH